MASSPYFSLAVLLLLPWALACSAGAGVAVGRVFSPAKPNAIKNAIYECGLESKGDAWVQFRSAYYLYAIIFLIFDVEAVFLLPFAVAFTGLGRGGVRWRCWCLCCCWLKGWRGPGPRAC